MNKDDNYMARNIRWISPFGVAIMVLITSIALQEVGLPLPVPNWIPVVIAIVGFCISGFYVVITDTISAKIMRFLIICITVVLIGAFFILG